MIYLLDTHIFLWSIIDPDKLSEKVLSVIQNEENTILISAVTIWEISVKYALGKLNLIGLEPDELIGYANGMGFEMIPLMPELAAGSYKLSANWHKDPFDRMLIWQAIQDNLTMISQDENIKKYQSSGLKIIW